MIRGLPAAHGAAAIALVAFCGGPLSAASTPAAYSTPATKIGVLLDDPGAKAVVGRYIPEFTTDWRIKLVRGTTLRRLQNYRPNMVTDAKLAAIDTELAALPPHR